MNKTNRQGRILVSLQEAEGERLANDILREQIRLKCMRGQRDGDFSEWRTLFYCFKQKESVRWGRRGHELQGRKAENGPQ